MSLECIACGSQHVAKLHAYKNVWLACAICGAVHRRKRDRFLASMVPGLDRLVRGQGTRNVLFGGDASRESATYDYYRDVCALGPGGTKWEREYETLQQELRPFGFSIDVSRVLDVSGGPGFLASTLMKKGVDAVVTEFSPHSVAKMHDVLGVEACVFDFNRQELRDVLPEGKRTFDAVLVRDSLNFCLDLGRFASGVHAVLERDGLLYLSYARPTLGCALHWDHDDYTFNVLYPSNHVRSVLEHAGFTFVGEVPTEHTAYGWTRDFDWRLKTFVLPYVALGLLNLSVRRLHKPGFGDLADLRTVPCAEVYRRR